MHPSQPSTVRFACLITLTGVIASAMPALGGPPTTPEFECPPGATDEGEPCDDSGGQDTVNGGCNVDPNVFGTVSCGQTLCGQAWALNGIRDTDNFIMVTEEDSFLSVTLTAEFPAIVFAVNVGPGLGCDGVWVIDPLLLPEGGTGTLEVPFPSSAGFEVWWFIGASVFDGLPCGGAGGFGNTYVASFSCAAVTCPETGDANSDGTVDFNDLLVVLGNFGPCP